MENIFSIEVENENKLINKINNMNNNNELM